MKKWIAILLALLLAALPACALAAQGDKNLGMNIQEEYADSYRSAAVVGDTLYLFGYDHLYSYRPGDSDLTAVEYEPFESGEDESTNIEQFFSDGERVWALASTYKSSETSYGVDRLELYEVTLSESGLEFGAPLNVDISELTTSYDGASGNVYLVQINQAIAADGVVYLQIYNDMGNGAVYALNLSDGTGQMLDVGECDSIARYRDGQILLTGWNYEDGTRYVKAYDPASESLTILADKIEVEASFDGLAYSEESGRLFYTSGGYVMACENFDFANAQPVAEMSAASYSNVPAMLLPGDFYVYVSHEVCAIRNTAPDTMPDTQLTVYNGMYTDSATKAYYEFTNLHGDVAVVLSQGYIDDAELVERMMNRDSSLDVYVMSASSKAYRSLLERGYMAELDSEAIAQAVGAMYPGMRAVLERDGQPVAVPVTAYAWKLGLNIEGFEKIGLSKEELPTDWEGFVDLLAELPDLLPDDGSVRVFDEYYTQGQVKEELMGKLFEDYHDYISADGRDPAYNTPEMQRICQKILDLDYEALGLKESDEDMGMGGMVIVGGGPNQGPYTLIQTGVGCTPGNFYSECTPWPLSIMPGETAPIALDVTVAFVNPFSKNVPLAQEFLEMMLKHMPDETRYTVSDELNEPKRSAYFEQNMKELDRMIEEMRGEIEKADPVNKPALEENLRSLEEARAFNEENDWMVSPEDLEWYRAHGDAICAQSYNYIYDDQSGEISEQMQQMFAGRIPPATLLKSIDQKLRMMILEGN